MHGSILILGSLLLDNGEREEWRRSHLSIDQKVFVRVPVRYGRRSNSWGNTFTITLSSDGSAGSAVLVPNKANIPDVNTLIGEARVLWKAEKRTVSQGDVGASWGCVGVLFRAGVDSGGWLQVWAKYFGANAHAISPVDGNGVFQIPWPTTLDGAPVDKDLILAIAAKAEATRPSVQDIADAWLSQNQGNERYFFENVRHGIRTPDDNLIWRRIEERNPHWLGNTSYAEPIALLQSEAAEFSGTPTTTDEASPSH